MEALFDLLQIMDKVFNFNFCSGYIHAWFLSYCQSFK
jgi:hypothetical protein